MLTFSYSIWFFANRRFFCLSLFFIRALASQSFYFIERELLLEIFSPSSKSYLRGRPHPWEVQETPVLIELVHLTQPARELLKGHYRKYPTVSLQGHISAQHSNNRENGIFTLVFLLD